ncbi:MAG: LysR substrate-binding domain-containing protein [Pseudomonadota bacterium]
MKNLTLRQLRYVEALAQHGHFGRAAEACAVSQPALSVQVKDLEETLGTDIFERTSRGVRLTTFGADVVARASDILRAVDDLGDMARAAQGNMVGRLRLGVIPTIAPYLLPRVLSDLGARYQKLDVQVRETVTPRLVTALNAGQIDCAILALPLGEPGLEERELFSERMMLVRPARDSGQPVPLVEALPEMRLLLLEEGHCFRDQALSFCNMPSVRAREGLDGSSLSTLVQLVGAGLGVTLVPEMAVPVETRSADVAVTGFPEKQPARRIGMVWRHGSPLTDHFDRVADIVRFSAEATKPKQASL